MKKYLFILIFMFFTIVIFSATKVTFLCDPSVNFSSDPFEKVLKDIPQFEFVKIIPSSYSMQNLVFYGRLKKVRYIFLLKKNQE